MAQTGGLDELRSEVRCLLKRENADLMLIPHAYMLDELRTEVRCQEKSKY